MGKVSSYDLIENIKRDILLLPKTHIVWSEILMRRYWHVANDGRAIELVRMRVNSAVNNFMVNEYHFIVRHPNFDLGRGVCTDLAELICRTLVMRFSLITLKEL